MKTKRSRLQLTAISENLMPPEKEIKKFQFLWKKHFYEDISKEDALENGIKLVRLLRLIYKPMTEQELLRLQKRRKETNNPNNN